ncbi:MAG: hypothetical protein GVY16_01760 [Planctomycetes bacterium]|jgi:peptidyl-prolyl cis-trans isomerase C|nr:hypothetical protein [Planctomycetota bacterium]
MRYVLLLLTTAVALTGPACEQSGQGPRTIEPREPSHPAPAADAADADGDVMATVNGEPIPMARLHEALVTDFGKPIAQQLIANEVVRQTLLEKGLPVEVSEKQLRQETYRAMNQLFNFQDEPSWPQVENLLNQFLKQKGLTRRIWDMSMRRNARLMRLAEVQVEVTQDELIRQYHIEYGAKWRVRHIQVPNLDTAQDLLEELKAGTDFEKLAFEHSTNPDARQGAWLPELSARADTPGVPKALVQAAMAMETPGELSNPVQAGTNFHILKLEEIIPPKDKAFEDVRATLEPAVRDRKVVELQQQLLKGLIAAAEIEYIDPTLRASMPSGDDHD